MGEHVLLSKRAAMVVTGARELADDPSNMQKRRDYLAATFNLDLTAQVIVELADAAKGKFKDQPK